MTFSCYFRKKNPSQMFHWVENTFLTSKILEMEFLEKNRMTGTDSPVLNFE